MTARGSAISEGRFYPHVTFHKTPDVDAIARLDDSPSNVLLITSYVSFLVGFRTILNH